MLRRAWVLIVGLLLVACDSSSEGPDPVSGTLTFKAEEGVDLLHGAVRDPGTFGNSDLYATRNGAKLRLATGGPNATQSRPVNWFMPSGVARRFASLAEVPNEKPSPDVLTQALLTTQAGNGFVLQRKDGGYTKGWIEAADSNQLTIQFEPLVEAE